jgi:hypothetical protein
MSSTSTTWGIDNNTDASSTSAPTWATASDITTTWTIDHNTSSQLHSLALSADYNNNGTSYNQLPIGYIYGTEILHGMSIVDLGIAIPELQYLRGLTGGMYVRLTPSGLWYGSAINDPINIYNDDWNETIISNMAALIPPPIPGLELFHLQVFSDVELDGTYFVSNIKNRSTWVESSDITTTWV